MHPLTRQASRRATAQLLGALGLGALGALGASRATEGKRAGQQKRKRRCRRRTRQCRRRTRIQCANCLSAPPPLPPGWMGTAEEWVAYACGIICVDLCGIRPCALPF